MNENILTLAEQISEQSDLLREGIKPYLEIVNIIENCGIDFVDSYIGFEWNFSDLTFKYEEGDTWDGYRIEELQVKKWYLTIPIQILKRYATCLKYQKAHLISKEQLEKDIILTSQKIHSMKNSENYIPSYKKAMLLEFDLESTNLKKQFSLTQNKYTSVSKYIENIIKEYRKDY